MAEVVRGVLGVDALGGYLYGSAMVGGLRPRSDVDVLVIAARRTTTAERRRLVEGLMAVSGSQARPPARPVELTLVVQADVRPWRYPPSRELQYGEWLRAEFERGTVPEPRPDPDLAVLLTQVLQGSAPIWGPEPAAILAPVPGSDLRRAVVDAMPGLLADLEPDTANVLLTLARIWATLATGAILTKDGAADWVIARLPPRLHPVLDRARAVYLGQADDTWRDGWSTVEATVAELVARIGSIDTA